MKKRLTTLLLALVMALSICTPALAASEEDGTTEENLQNGFEIDPVDAWMIWSQTDERWAENSISSKGYGKYNMRKQGCLVTAIAKVFVYAGQQEHDGFTPGDCLDVMLDYGMLTSSGALSGGVRMNTNGLLEKYAPNLTYVAYSVHKAWKQETAYNKISAMMEDNVYVIIRAYNKVTGNNHYMAVHSVEDGAVYVMDNYEIIDLYGSGKYGGITQELTFEYSGELSYPAWDSLRPEQEMEIPEEESAEETVFASLGNFVKTNEYTPGFFTDVTEDKWYYDSVVNAYELDLVAGIGGGKFGTGSEFTVSGAIAVAARLHSIYYKGSAEFEQGDPWYQIYVDYAVANGIIKENEYDDYTRSATRGEIVRIFSAALPDEALPVLNDLPDGFIPDVSAGDAHASAAYRLYRAGILTGVDSAYSLNAGADISREEIAAIVSRLAILPLRQVIDIG